MNNSDFKYLDIETGNGQCDVTLNRPEKRNALNVDVIEELHSCFDWLATEKAVKVVVIRGAGSVFCSGADLGYMKSLRSNNYTENLRDSQHLAALYLKIMALPKPTVAVVKGAALAGGCGLATVCDFVVAASSSKFGYPEVKIGFVAAMVSVFLIRQVGERNARDLLLSGRLIDADEAFRMGLINIVCKTEQLEQHVTDLLKSLKTNSVFAMGKTKEILNNFRYSGIEEDVMELAKLNAEYRQSDDFLEGVSAFLEKGNPNGTFK